MKLVIIISILFVLSFKTLNAQEISVDFSATRQTILANGINFDGYHRSGGAEVIKPKFNKMLDELKSDLVRVGIPLYSWESSNDDNDPNNATWKGFNYTETRNSFLRLKELQERGYRVWVSVWDVANWLVSYPSNESGRKINNLGEFAECICTYLLHARDTYGAEPEFISINEPSIADENGWGGYQIALTAAEQAQIIRLTGERFYSLGIKTRWMIALHKVYPSELLQAKEIYSDTIARKYIGGNDIHAYWFQTGHEAELAAWKDWASTLPIPSYCGECDYDNTFWLRTDQNLWKTHAMETAKLYYSMYNIAGVNGSLVWYGHAPDNSTPYRYASKHFFDYLRPGIKIADSKSSDPSVFVTAAVRSTTDSCVIILQNTSTMGKVVKINGLKDKEMEWIESKEDSYYKKLGNVKPSEGKMQLTLAPLSINTLQSVKVELGTLIYTPSSGVKNTEDSYIISPNPFSESFIIQSNREDANIVGIEMYDLSGKKLLNIDNKDIVSSPVFKVFPVDNTGEKLENGIYFLKINYQMAGEHYSQVQKMILIR